MTFIADQVYGTFQYYRDRFVAAIDTEKRCIENNYNCFISNFSEEKLYVKVPIILGELINLVRSPTGYLIGKAIAFPTAQWAPATVNKVKACVPERFSNLSKLQKCIIGAVLSYLSVVYVPTPIFYGALSLGTGLYYSQPQQKQQLISLHMIPI